MIKNIYKCSVIGVSILLLSCGENVGGNKSIFPVNDDSTSKEAHHEETVASHSESDKELKYDLSITAYKTAEKKPVEVSFTDIQFTSKQESDSLLASLEGGEFVIKTASITSDDPARIPNLKTFFFEKWSGEEIKGSFVSIQKDKATIKLQLNGVTAQKDFTVSGDDNHVVLEGTLDMTKDFNLLASFESISQACKALHEDKTWPDLVISVSFSK